LTLFDDPIEVRGALLKVWFRNPENGYVAGQFEVAGRREKVSVRGALGDLQLGQPVTLRGRFEEHPRYGRQLAVESFEIERPQGRVAVQAYLGSGLVKGIGPKLAERIVTELGEQALEVIESDPKRLARVRGIGGKKAKEIQQAVQAQMGLREVMLFLHGHGLSPALAHKVFEAYGRDAPRLLKNNPYRLADDLVGVGFKRADEVAARLGIAEDSEERKQAGLLYALQQAVQREGHCCLPRGQLLAAASQVLGQPAEALTGALAALRDAGRVVVERLPGLPVLADGEDECVYPLTLHLAETALATALDRLATSPPTPIAEGADRAIADCQKSARLTLEVAQRGAVRSALVHPVCVITGGPGVGKTTIVRALAQIVEAHGRRIALAAPTGRAAKRLSEATGRPASTLHRLLEFQPGTYRFQRDERRPLEADVVVVDESSMLDLPLAYALVRAVAPGTHLVLVGDADQLPSVGPGRVLEDVIQSGRVDVVRLTEIFRQKRGSRIVVNAHRIREGVLPDVTAEPPATGAPGVPSSDFYFVEQRDPARALSVVLRLVKERIPQAFGLDPIADVQVLAPMYRGVLGVDRLNEELGALLVPDAGQALAAGARRYRTGDKVLQVRNNYDLELFNGDLGRVVLVAPEERRVVVRFPDKDVTYQGEEIDEIVPAYAITVHRAQGSEYPAVVLVLDQSHLLMLNRRLLYTAVTRASQLMILVGSRWALERAVGSDDEGRRCTGLQRRLAQRVIGDGVHPELFGEAGA
jgi:exodeoxyribonuclease V alpha subunit